MAARNAPVLSVAINEIVAAELELRSIRFAARAAEDETLAGVAEQALARLARVKGDLRALAVAPSARRAA